MLKMQATFVSDCCLCLLQYLRALIAVVLDQS